jgi:hypothetical protein
VHFPVKGHQDISFFVSRMAWTSNSDPPCLVRYAYRPAAEFRKDAIAFACFMTLDEAGKRRVPVSAIPQIFFASWWMRERNGAVLHLM